MSYPGLLEVVYQVLNGRNPPGKKIIFWNYYDDYYVDDDDGVIVEWHDYNDHRKRKAQKAKIKKELTPIA